jgi:transcriptional regulator with XRE-family HTH domain
MPEQPDLPVETERLDLSALAHMLRERRGELSLRAAANDAGVSFSTFTRVEDGSQPDLATFMQLSAWLGVAPSSFFRTSNPERERTPLEHAVAHLQADPALKPEAAAQITTLMTQMYTMLAQEGATQNELLVACHLRSRTALRPGVAPRLGSLLKDIQTELARRLATGDL